MNKFRESHFYTILDAYDAAHLPIDLFLRNYFLKHKAIGSKDRKSISENIYSLIRWKGLADYFCTKPITWEKRFEAFKVISKEKVIQDEKIPLHIRLSFPKYFFQLITKAYGEEKASELCLALNNTAPTTIRVNLLKISRETLLKKWEGEYEISPCKFSETGIVFHKKINFFGLDEFKKGFFEIQDEASQLVANLIMPKPGDEVLDYCAGSGGKALAFAHSLKGKGQLYLHDVRQGILIQAKKRLKRAGIQNAQCFLSSRFPKKTFLNRMQWILVDVPCSGSGTLRRNPDQKWKFNENMLEELMQKQREIFSEAIKFLHPQGRIVYATCSILPEENANQVSYFMKKHALRLISPPFYSLPTPGGMDGFYAAVLEPRSEKKISFNERA